MRLIDLEELERNLDDSMYVDPYEIPGFLEHCKKECQVIDAIPISFVESYLLNIQYYIRRTETYMYDSFTKRNWPIIKDSIIGLITEWRKVDGKQ